MKKIQFPSDICRGKSIINHDYVFWCGDFNYRIDMANDQVKLLISKENWQLLSEGDQLLLQVWGQDEIVECRLQCSVPNFYECAVVGIGYCEIITA